MNMSTDNLILYAAGGFFLAALAYSEWRSRAPQIRAVISPSAPSKPVIRAALDSIEDRARDMAAIQIESDLATHYAAQHKASVKAAFGADIPKSAPPAS